MKLFTKQILFCLALMSLTCFNFTFSIEIKKLKTENVNLVHRVRYVEVIKSDIYDYNLQISQLVVKDGMIQMLWK